MKIYDCFGFNDENHLLEIRLNELDKYVDYFVIVEFGETHQGNKKNQNIDKNLIDKFKSKIRYYYVDSFENIKEPHGRDQYQRNYLSKGLYDAEKNDLILLSDIDEIPNLKKIEISQVANSIIAFSQVHSMYKLNLCLDEKWIGSKICRFQNLKSLQWLRSLRTKKYSFFRIDKLLSPRYSRNVKIINNGGWHFGWLRTSDSIIKKLESYAHSEHNTEYFKNKNLLDQCIREKKNFFNKRETLRTKTLEELPDYIQKNFEKYKDWLA